MKQILFVLLAFHMSFFASAMTRQEALNYINNVAAVFNANISGMGAEQMTIDSYEVTNSAFVTNMVVNEDVMTVGNYYKTLMRDKPWAYYFNSGMKELCDALILLNMSYVHRLVGSKSGEVMLLTLTPAEIKQYTTTQTDDEDLAKALLESLRADVPQSLGLGFTKTDVQMTKEYFTFYIFNDESVFQQNQINENHFWNMIDASLKDQMIRSIFQLMSRLGRGIKYSFYKGNNKLNAKTFEINNKELLTIIK